MALATAMLPLVAPDGQPGFEREIPDFTPPARLIALLQPSAIAQVPFGVGLFTLSSLSRLRCRLSEAFLNLKKAVEPYSSVLLPSIL